MNDAAILQMIKIDLGISADAYDDMLGMLMAAAKSMIENEGLSIDTAASKEDAALVVMYTAYLWRKRREESAAMPRMLRWALNNAILKQKAQGGDANG